MRISQGNLPTSRTTETRYETMVPAPSAWREYTKLGKSFVGCEWEECLLCVCTVIFKCWEVVAEGDGSDTTLL
jgi:hypothetical protein